MPRFEVRQFAQLRLTTYSGLALIGQCCEVAQVEMVIDPRLLVSAQGDDWIAEFGQARMCVTPSS